MDKQEPRTPENDPCVLLGFELTRIRIAAGFTTRQALASAMGFERSVVGKGESGDRPPSPQVFPIWLDTCGITGTERDMLTRQWVLARNFAGVPVWFRPWIEIEESADFIKIWCPLLIPGLLQTEEYIRTLILMAGLDQEETEERITARLKRQRILDGDDPTRLTVLIDESVLYRLVGSPEIMVRQLRHLLEMSQRRAITIRIVRSPVSLHGMTGAFDIASSADFPGTMRRSALDDEIVRDRERIIGAVEVFDQIREAALKGNKSQAAIVEAIEWWQSESASLAGEHPAIAFRVAASALRLAMLEA